jgi:putative protease
MGHSVYPTDSLWSFKERFDGMNRKIEILAPAGSYESMRAAMNAGCDAVYIGGYSFGARAYANNLEEETLLRAIDEAHIRDKRLYLTVNTLLKEEELKDKLYGFLSNFYEQGLDAVIVQDPGVMHFIHRNFPKLPIHASTQTTITMAQGAELLAASGVTRLVTARELSLKEIKAIRENTELEIETFVHGALCYCYSGQCLMSSMIGGRSGNRGRCAQPCRMPYQFFSGEQRLSEGNEKYLLSPKDIHTIALVPDLIEAGIDSFKIEGRMKSPAYSAGVSEIYRRCADLYLTYGRERYQEYLRSSEYETDRRNLMDLYNRGGFSEGYGKTYHGKQMMSLYRPNHSGVPVGEVAVVKGSQVTILLKEDIHAQDILEIRQLEEDGYEFTVKNPAQKGETLTTNTGKLPAEREKGKTSVRAIRPGALVYRTRNNELLNRITASYIEQDARLGIRGVLTARLGQKLKFTVSYKDYTATAYQEEVQAAVKQPMTKEKLAAPLEKLGDTLYYPEQLMIEAVEDIFVPVAWLNEIRRDAIRKLTETVTGAYRREKGSRTFEETGLNEAGRELLSETSRGEAGIESFAETCQDENGTQAAEGSSEYGAELEWNTIASVRNGAGTAAEPVSSDKKQKEIVKESSIPGICVTVRTMEQFQTAVTIPEVGAIYADYDGFSAKELLKLAGAAASEGKRFYPALPHICRLSVYEKLKKEMGSLWEAVEVTGFIAKNFEEISLLQSLQKEEGSNKEIILNHNMYVFNREAKAFWSERGFRHFTAPLELNSKELKTLGIADCDLMVYGYLPLMVSAQCLHESTEGCKRCRTGEQRTDYLLDRMDKKFYVQTNCNGCYNVILNGQCLSLLRYPSEVNALKPRNIRLDFTMETGRETQEVIASFQEVYRKGRSAELKSENLTAGHFKRGVE